MNVAANGLRGFLEGVSPWIVCFWCLAHRLELALQDALKSTFFSNIDDLLLRLYYLYQNSPKKCRQLEDIVESLKLCLDKSDMPTSKGIRPIRASGTRFVSHKVAALGRVIDRYGAYISHLVSLTEDTSVKSVDKQKLKGYIKKWNDGKTLIGCAFFYDLLKPCSIISKALQDEELSVVDVIEALLKTNKSIEKLKSMSLDDFPSVKKVMSRVQHTDGEYTYQGAQLAYYQQGVDFLKSHKDQIITSVLSCLKDRIKVHYPELLTNILTVLATQGWEKSASDDFADAALSSIIEHFSVPLVKADFNVNEMEEWKDLLDYLNLTQESNRVIWWKLYNAACSKTKWFNILGLVELLFCMPLSNGTVERVFSSLKLVKSERRTSLSEDHLDDLVRISVDGPPLCKWDATKAVKLWWDEKQRRQVNDQRKPPTRKDQPGSDSEDESDDSSETLTELWDTFIG